MLSIEFIVNNLQFVLEFGESWSDLTEIVAVPVNGRITGQIVLNIYCDPLKQRPTKIVSIWTSQSMVSLVLLTNTPLMAFENLSS